MFVPLRFSMLFKDILDAIKRDASEVYLEGICAHSDSYNVGKAFGMAARLASISRAFGTNHYQSIDNSIKNCLEKWLRIQGTIICAILTHGHARQLPGG
jgi:hypothetical protein